MKHGHVFFFWQLGRNVNQPIVVAWARICHVGNAIVRYIMLYVLHFPLSHGHE
jgi:hypothetical protein